MDAGIVKIGVGDVTLEGELTLPPRAQGLVIFAHGTGASRPVAHNRLVGRLLEERGIGTLLLELMTADEERTDGATRRLQSDIDLIAGRLTAAIDWAFTLPAGRGLRVGLFGPSTGAAAALRAAALRPTLVDAVVSSGGRPDLANLPLATVAAPTLLVVGANDGADLERSQAAARELPNARVEVVLGASHLFEEPGALEEVARLARDFFIQHLGGHGAVDAPLPFANRRQAARLLARRLLPVEERGDVVVLGIARGGVPVAAALARILDLPLDVLVVRRLTAPGSERERDALGAIAPGGVRVVTPRAAARVWSTTIEKEAAREGLELARTERRFRGRRPPLDVRGKVALLVDDGAVTGATLRAAILWAQRNGADQVWVAVPVAPSGTIHELAGHVDKLVCVATPVDFCSIAEWYLDFHRVGDDEVVALLGEEFTPRPTLT